MCQTLDIGAYQNLLNLLGWDFCNYNLILALRGAEATMKLTEEHLKGLIADASYHRLDGTTVTICALTLRSGFVVTGESVFL